MRAVATKSLVFWPRACWSKGCFFGHWRSGTTFPLATGGATRRAIRKHRAPNGALRHDVRETREVQIHAVRKHRAPNGALRQHDTLPVGRFFFRQKAPSAKRCIITTRPPRGSRRGCSRVRKHRAPKGALRLTCHVDTGRLRDSQKAPSAKRCIKTWRTWRSWVRRERRVRKHRAPKGALRPRCAVVGTRDVGVRKHQAPNGALRLVDNGRSLAVVNGVRKHRAPKGALRQYVRDSELLSVALSESTERQKAH